MDPDVTLALAREHTRAVEACSEEDAEGQLEQAAIALGYYQALDDWISKGGFLPEAWAATVGALPAL